jgi:hypothetical protein
VIGGTPARAGVVVEAVFGYSEHLGSAAGKSRPLRRAGAARTSGADGERLFQLQLQAQWMLQQHAYALWIELS